MADTSHGLHIPEDGEKPNAIVASHFKHCIDCRREVGEHVSTRDRQRKPWRTEEDVVAAQEKEALQPDIRTHKPEDVPPAVRPHVWQEKTWPVEAIQLTPTNIRSVAAWCGGQLLERADAISVNEQFEIRLPSFKGMLEGHVGYYVFRYRHTGRFDIMKPAAFEEKYDPIGLRGRSNT